MVEHEELTLMDNWLFYDSFSTAEHFDDGQLPK
jgi:hypothetical protein